jgi:hypothetical protein
VDVLQRVLRYAFLQNATIYISVEQARNLWGNGIGLTRPRLSEVEEGTATGGTFPSLSAASNWTVESLRCRHIFARLWAER